MRELKESAALAVGRNTRQDRDLDARERRPLIAGDSDFDTSSGDSDDDEFSISRPGDERPAGFRTEPVDKVMNALPFGPFHWRVTALFGLAQCGFCMWILLPVFTNAVYADSTALTREQLALCSTAFFGGWAAATPPLSQVADRLGRRRMGLLYYALGVLVGIRTQYVMSFTALAATRAVLGGLCGGAASVNYVWCTELLPSSAVAWATAMIASAYSVGFVFTAAAAYAVLEPMQDATPADAQRLGYICALLPSLYLGLALRYLDETPAWLVSVNRLDEAGDVVARCAERNDSRTFLPVRPFVLVAANSGGKDTADGGGGGRLVSLWRGELFRQLVALCFTWFAVTCAYYGLAFQANKLPGSVYITASVLSLADIPGNALYSAMAEMPACGRRRTQNVLFLIGAAMLLAMALVLLWQPQPQQQLDGSGNPLEPEPAPMFSFVNACAVLGKLFMAAAFNGVYVYVVEIFPVEVRAGAMGVCNVAARVGGMFAPVIAELNVSVASTIFGLLALGAALTTARVLPETRGRGEGEGALP